jgi:hypothetical protein
MQKAKKCAAKGIKFGYHNHDKEFEEVEGTIRYDYMLQNTDPSKVFFQLDLSLVTNSTMLLYQQCLFPFAPTTPELENNIQYSSH